MRFRWWMLVVLVILAACALGCADKREPLGQGETHTEEGQPQQELMDKVRDEGSKLHIFDWAEWWPEEIYEGFSREYNVEIIRDNFADLDEMLTKFKLQPDVPYDLTLPDVRVFFQMKELGLLQEINREWVPNVNNYLADRYRDVWFNPGYRYGVPLYVYFVGYCYNSRHVDENDPRIGRWALLFEGKEYAGKITMLDDMYNVIGSALKYLGYSYSSDEEDELSRAKDLLLQQKPWVIAYDSWPKRLVLEEEAFLSHSWVGEAWLYHKDLDIVKGVLPEEGTEMGLDCFVVPKGARHPAAAHLFIDYLFRPEVYALMLETIGYAPVHLEVARMLPEEMQEWPGVVPTKELLEKCEFIQTKAFTGKGLELRTAIWEELKR